MAVPVGGVIIERAQRRDGVVERRGSVLLKGVRKIFSEFFEKSIDKEEIDAILNSTVRFRSRDLRFSRAVCLVCLLYGGRAEPSRYKEAANVVLALCHGHDVGKAQGIAVLNWRVFFEKC